MTCLTLLLRSLWWWQQERLLLGLFQSWSLSVVALNSYRGDTPSTSCQDGKGHVLKCDGIPGIRNFVELGVDKAPKRFVVGIVQMCTHHLIKIVDTDFRVEDILVLVDLLE